MFNNHCRLWKLVAHDDIKKLIYNTTLNQNYYTQVTCRGGPGGGGGCGTEFNRYIILEYGLFLISVIWNRNNGNSN